MHRSRAAASSGRLAVPPSGTETTPNDRREPAHDFLGDLGRRPSPIDDNPVSLSGHARVGAVYARQEIHPFRNGSSPTSARNSPERFRYRHVDPHDPVRHLRDRALKLLKLSSLCGRERAALIRERGVERTVEEDDGGLFQGGAYSRTGRPAVQGEQHRGPGRVFRRRSERLGPERGVERFMQTGDWVALCPPAPSQESLQRRLPGTVDSFQRDQEPTTSLGHVGRRSRTLGVNP